MMAAAPVGSSSWARWPRPLISTRLEFGASFAAFLVLDDQRGAVFGLVRTIFRIHRIHGAGFVLGDIGLADKAGESLTNFGLPTLNFH